MRGSWLRGARGIAIALLVAGLAGGLLAAARPVTLATTTSAQDSGPLD
jgi:ABC-type tungstate transport system permease subunit